MKKVVAKLKEVFPVIKWFSVILFFVFIFVLVPPKNLSDIFAFIFIFLVFYILIRIVVVIFSKIWFRFFNKKFQLFEKPEHFHLIDYCVIAFFIIIACLNYFSNNFEKPVFFCGKEKVRQAIESVVAIEGDSGSGSGFFISQNEVLTNNHVISFNENLKVRDYKGRSLEAYPIATDTLHDLAILRIRIPFDYEMQGLSWKEKPSELLDEVYALGYPMDSKEINITKGIISALSTDKFNKNKYIQTDSAINSGNSGGPLVDTCGKVVGINTMTMRNAQNIGRAIRSDQIEKLIKEMLSRESDKISVETDSNYSSDQSEVVARYYDALGQGLWEEAFDFYSARRQKDTNFEDWIKGFINTYAIVLKEVKNVEVDNTVFVSIYVIDYVDDYSYDVFSKEFQGSWTLVKENGLWKLDKSDIYEIK